MFSGLHLKAPGHANSGKQRQKQANYLSNYLQSLVKNDEYLIITGDFNDEDESCPAKGSGKVSSKSLKTIRSEKLNLQNATCKIPEKFQQTGEYDDKPFFFDHILYDSRLTVKGHAFVHQTEMDDQNPDRLSDHRPVEITFDLDGSH
jgi:endonuclease/exonuclease/phosphatase family metal-dependent hydrolase